MSKLLAKEGPKCRVGNGTVARVRIENSAAALIEELQKHRLAQGLAVVWQMQNVCWGRWEDGRLSFPDGNEASPDYWQELRVFNSDAELHLLRRGGELIGRFRSDTGEMPIEYVDAMSLLWGERDKEQKAPEGYVRLIDQSRDISMTVPYEGPLATGYGLVTRNYVEAAPETKQAGYVDYRFVRIVDADMKGV